MDIQLPVESVPVITKVVSLNPSYGKVYLIQQLCDKVMRFVAGRWFSQGTPVSSTNKTGRHDITEILLKVVFNTITLTLFLSIEIMLLVIHCMYFSVRNQ